MRARLRARAAEQGLDFNQALQYYAMERFLYRMSKTHWAPTLILKGAAMLRVWDGAIARPTRDIDFLGTRIDGAPEAVAAMVRECLGVESDDGLEFSAEVLTEAIAVEGQYPGVRATVQGRLSGARIRLQLDMVVGDSVVPPPKWVDYPTLLDTEPPRILAYQPASAIAEKFEAVASRGLRNSRMKDYYDMWMLSESVPVDGSELCESIRSTFSSRGTEVPVSLSAVLFESEQQSEIVTLWNAFVKRMRVSGIDAPESLPDVVGVIDELLVPPSAAVVDGQPFSLSWTPGEGWGE